MHSLLFIALGGALGALGRYGLANFIHGRLDWSFPLGTLCVNTVGSFFIGIMYVLIVEKLYLHPEWKSVLIVGFLGAFTTFSTFSLESVQLLGNGQAGTALAYMALSLVLCLGATASAIALTRLFF